MNFVGVRASPHCKFRTHSPPSLLQFLQRFEIDFLEIPTNSRGTFLACLTM